MKISLYKLLFIDNHVITKIIKSKFIIGYISDVRTICSTALFRLHVIQYNTYGQPQELMYFAHPLSITLCQIVIDCNDVHALAFQGIQICRQCGYQCLTFTCLHLSNTSLMQDNTTDQLYPVMLHTQYTLGSFTYSGKSLRQKIIQCGSLFQAFLIFSCFVTQFFIC